MTQVNGEPPHPSESALVTFLYLICRDLVQPGRVEEYVERAQPGDLTNRYLAEYAENCAERLMKDWPDDGDMIPHEVAVADRDLIGKMKDALAWLRVDLEREPETEYNRGKLSVVAFLERGFGSAEEIGTWENDRNWQPGSGKPKPCEVSTEVEDYVRLDRASDQGATGAPIQSL